MADLSSILGGMVQGFKDFGTGLVDLFGTGGAAIGDAISSIQTGRATTKNQDDFRKWLYNTDSTKDAAAKGLGTALNGVSTVADVIPGAQAVTANPLFNGLQGAIGGISDELKMAGENADWGKAAQRAGIGAASGLASGYAGQALGKSGNKLLSNGLTRGAVSGALGGGIANAGYTGIEGGSVQDMINAGLYGAQTGALVGGTTGLARELIKPAHKMDAKLTDAERQARIENAQAQIDELGPVPLFSDDPEYVAKRARKLELNDAIKAYRSGYDTVDEYNAAMAAKRANKREYKAPEAQYAPRIGEEVMLDATQAPEGYTRLYRGLENEFDPKYVPQVSDNGYGYESWSDTYDLAREYAGPNGNVYTVDVPNSRIATQTVTPDGERMPVVKTDKKAGMKSFDGERFIDGKEYLLNVNDPLRQELTYSKVKPKTVADLMTESKPKTIYHGTNAVFEDFDESLPSVWFTDNADDIANTGLSNKGGKINIMERELPNNLKLADWDLADRLTKQQLIDRGYDGIAYTESGTSGKDTYYEIFKPNKTLKKIGKAPQKTVADLMLSPEQKEFFKDSVIRDENGNLKPMYHGTRSNFTVFGDNAPQDTSNSHASVGYWFTPDEEGAKNFAKSVWYGDEDPKAMKTYLNVKNPKIYETVDNSAAIEPLVKRLQELELDSNKLSDTELYRKNIYHASTVQNMINLADEDTAVDWLSREKGYEKQKAIKLVDEIADIKRLADEKANLQNEISELKYGDAYQRFKTDLYKVDGQTANDANAGGVGMALNDKNSIKKYVDNLKAEGYDGIIIKGTNYDADVMGGPNDQYVVFDSNQIKSVNNKKPTKSANINYALAGLLGTGGLAAALAAATPKDDKKKKSEVK